MSESKFSSTDSYVDFMGLLKLKDLERALISYKDTATYDAVLRYYFGCIALLDSPQMLEPLGLLKQALGTLQGASRRRRAAEPPSSPGAAADVAHIYSTIEHFEARLSNSIVQLKQPATEVPKNLHFVWLGGGVGAIQRDYINIWKQVMGAEGYRLSLWHDSDALLAYETNRIIVEAAKADAMLHGGQSSVDGLVLGDRYEERVIVLKQQMYAHIKKAVENGGSADEARIDLLVRAYGQDKARLTVLRNTNQLSLQALAGDHLALRDLAGGEVSLQLKDIYEREISLRGNFAAASDVVRIEALFAEGGSYTDVDNLPPLLEALGGVDIREFQADARLGVLQLMLDRNPEWMPGRQALRDRYTNYFEMIPSEHRVALERFANSQPGLERVFRTPVERLARPDELRAVAVRNSLSNAFLIAHPGSAMLQAVLDRFRLNYEIVDATARLADEQNVALTDVKAMIDLAQQAATKALGAFHELAPEVELAAAFLVEAAATYYSDGIRPQSEVTIYLTGPSAMREGMAAYQRAHFTPGIAEKWQVAAVIPDFATVNRATEEELDHSWKENESDLGQWLENEKQRWQEGQFKARYAGEMAELLKYRTLQFDEGWPVIEGRHVLSTDLLQHLADELGEPFMQAMNRGHSGVVTFKKAIPLGFDERQSILAQSAAVLPPASLSDPQTQQLSTAELLNRLAEDHFDIAQLSPLQRLLLAALTGAEAVDNRTFDAARPRLENLVNTFRKSGTAGGYATIERALYQQRAPAFLAGLASAADYPSKHDETALALKKVALQKPLTLRQLGKYVARIQQAAKLEHRVGIIERIGLVLDVFEAGTAKLVPQDLLLQGEGDRVGGRCYPLALAMAAALSVDKAAANTLRERFFLGVIEPEASDSVSFLSLMESLRDVQVADVGSALARSDLGEVVQRLAARTTTATLMLNSDNHAMLVAKTFESERDTYHFYDPNFGVFEFADSTVFKQALEQFFLEQDMARYYAAYGDATRPTFDLVELDGARVADLALPGEMKVSRLLKPGALPGQPSVPLKQRIASARGQSLQKNPRLGSCLSALDGHWLAQQIAEVTTHLEQANALPSDLVPLFDTLEIMPDGSYRMSMVDPAHPERAIRINTRDHRLLRIKSYLSELFSVLANRPAVSSDPTEVGSVHTLNAGFAIQALMNALRGREDAGRRLSWAVRLHAYVNYAQLVHGNVVDIAGLVTLVRQALAEEKLIARTVAPVVKASVGISLNEATGGLLQLANVGFDIYQLSTAQNEVERTQFGTQLAFDSASLALSVGAYVAGATTVGAVLGGASVMLGGLAVGAAALAQGFATIAEEAKQVGLFFDEVANAHLQAYQFNTVHGTWMPRPSLIVQTVDLVNAVLTMDSPKLYPLRDHFGVPTFANDYQRAIDIGRELNLPRRVSFTPGPGQAIMLPCTPQTCYRYEYKALPFANQRHDTGFDIARRLEKKNADGGWLFLFSFYSFPSEYILHRLFDPDYRPTAIEVLLDGTDRSLVVPVLPASWHGKIAYRIQGAGKRCTLLLNPGVSLTLDASRSLDSTWVLDAAWARESDIRIERYGKLFIGDVQMAFTGTGRHDVLLRAADQRTFQADLGTRQLNVVEDAVPSGMDRQALREHLKTLARQHRLVMPYTPVHDYQVPFEKPGEPRYITAWYDAREDRFLCIREEIPGADEAVLGAVAGGYAWFYNPQDVRIWQVDATTGLLIRHYWLWDSLSATTVIKSIEADAQGVIHVVQQTTRQGGGGYEAAYVIHEEQLLLSSIIKKLDAELEPLLSASEFLGDWAQVLGDGYVYSPSLGSENTFDTVTWQPAPFVSICWKIDDTSRDMAWIRRSDRLIIRPSPRPKHYRGWPDSIKNMTDLTLLPLAEQGDIFMIYDRSRKDLSRRQRTVVAGKASWSTQWKQPENLEDIIATEGGYVILTSDGLFFSLTRRGVPMLGGVNEQWFQDRVHWWSALQPLARRYGAEKLALVGLTNATGAARLCAWHIGDRLLLADLGLKGEVRVLSVTPDGEAAWLFDVSNGKVYRQAFIDPQELEAAFGQGSRLLQAGAIPVATREWERWQFVELSVEGPGLRGVSVEGVVVALRDHEPVRIVGVTQEWVALQDGREQEALEQLATQPLCSALLTVEEPGNLKWFVAQTGRMIRVPKAAIPQSYEVLGTQRQTSVLLHASENGKLLTFPGAGQVGTLSYAQREGEVLVVEGQGMRIENLLPLIPDDVTTLVLRMGEGAMSYRLSRAAWLRVNSVILDCRHSLAGAAQIPGELIWELDEPDELLLDHVDEHLVIIDSNSGHGVIFREAYATGFDFSRDVMLSFGGNRQYAVSTLIARLGDVPSAQGATTLKELSKALSPVETNLVS
ncbi:TcdA/TcdB pore-forming domain-containing protein [Pseudomonas brassicacearum]|uniref:Toxin n=1 Tax=Pseudomonas brassicacearum subsp. neoaurantiaca TaxID=494916 RepID=A0A7V8RJ52_9PSED|nr:TcdA/TcdB pore-forming domain-containing protein [Pseudomonas brassicacearum]MBA1377479.1 toxin [Pseudomonas brassicacearum subsp. neoaurantiaca]